MGETFDLRQHDGVFVPEYLGPEDHPWLEALVDELRRFGGRPLREWRARAREPLRAASPERRRRLAQATLERLCDLGEPRKGMPHTRAVLFEEAQRARAALTFQRSEVIARAAARLGVDAGTVIPALFADIPLERPLRVPQDLPDPATLTRLCNLSMCQSLLRSASGVEVVLSSRSRALVRQILLRRLLCVVHPLGDGVRIEVSGVFALFRHTTLYGRALASLIPVLRTADRFTVLARRSLGDREMIVRLSSGDPIFPPGVEPRRYDSKLEERFARDFARIAPGWDLVREPEPVPVDGTFVFPDFALVDRRDARHRWLLEIVGFWTPEYLRAKLDRLARAGREDIILCVDQQLGGAPMVELRPRVVLFRRTVDVVAVKAILEAPTPPPVQPNPSSTEVLGLRDLFIDFAGRRPGEDPLHARLDALRPGAPVGLVEDGAWIHLVDGAGLPVAALSGWARQRWGPCLAAIQRARVVEIVERTSGQTSPAYRSLLKVARWRVPIVEVEVVRSGDSDGGTRRRTGLGHEAEAPVTGR